MRTVAIPPLSFVDRNSIPVLDSHQFFSPRNPEENHARKARFEDQEDPVTRGNAPSGGPTSKGDLHLQPEGRGGEDNDLREPRCRPGPLPSEEGASRRHGCPGPHRHQPESPRLERRRHRAGSGGQERLHHGRDRSDRCAPVGHDPVGSFPSGGGIPTGRQDRQGVHPSEGPHEGTNLL